MNAKELQEIRRARKSYFSQSGEDGFLEYVLEKLPIQDHWCVEFGAWDGKHLSNTYYFVSKKSYNVVLIEADSSRHAELVTNMKDYNAICMNAFVGFEGDSTLDKLLSKTQIPKDFDLLSIDIDGDDYFVWEAVKCYNPKVVIIEINIRDKPDITRINAHGSPFVMGISGTSIKSMTELAVRKGYRLIAHIGCNAIYVRNDFFKYFYSFQVNPEDVFTYEGHSIFELTKDEIESAKFWGHISRARLISKLIPEPLRPLVKKVYKLILSK